MSFRELKGFCDTMEMLGFSGLSIESFRTPNFPLVSEALYWLVHRFDPKADIPDRIETESERIAFLTAVTQVVASRVGIVLKTRDLYAADGHAVREMLKLARKLREAVLVAHTVVPGEQASSTSVKLVLRSAEMGALRATASELNERGARLFDLLTAEKATRETRSSSLRFLETLASSLDARAEHELIDRSIRDAISNVKDGIGSLEQQTADLREDERSLESKLKKRQAELLRGQKRLESLTNVRPAFMDEYERLEKELAQEYEAYVLRYRNLDYLQHELELERQHELDRAAGTEREMLRLQRKLREEEARAFRGDDEEAATPPGIRVVAAAASPAPAAASAAAPAKRVGADATASPAIRHAQPPVRAMGRGDLGSQRVSASGGDAASTDSSISESDLRSAGAGGAGDDEDDDDLDGEGDDDF